MRLVSVMGVVVEAGEGCLEFGEEDWMFHPLLVD